MDEMLISVIVPIYNAEKYLKICIDSIINQSYYNIQIILVDDGSEDNCPAICDEYAQLDTRIIVIHKKNQGLVLARKSGLQIATGEYITFVDADDYIDIDTYEKIVNNINYDMPDIIAYDLIEEYSDRTVKKENQFSAGLYKEEQLKEKIYPKMLSTGVFFEYGILPNLVCKFIRNDFAKKAGIEVNGEVRFGEDADATFQYMAKAQSVQIIHYAPYHYCKREGTMVQASVKKECIKYLQSDLEKTFFEAGIYETMKNQLADYINFVTLLKNPQAVLEHTEIFTNTKVALYGAGGFGQAVLKQYSDSISLVADSNYIKFNNISSPVISPEELVSRQSEFDKVFITILNINLCEKIRDSLLAMGLKKEVIFYSVKG
jgi:glycosyltransferase involved in cell wall biosynthesis